MSPVFELACDREMLTFNMGHRQNNETNCDLHKQRLFSVPVYHYFVVDPGQFTRHSYGLYNREILI